MTHYLLKFNKDWADEFNVHGFRIVDEEQFNSLNEKLSDNEEEFNFYFGTNEGWDDDGGTVGEVWNEIVKIEIDEKTANQIVKLFGARFGVFPF